MKNLRFIVQVNGPNGSILKKRQIVKLTHDKFSTLSVTHDNMDGYFYIDIKHLKPLTETKEKKE